MVQFRVIYNDVKMLTFACGTHTLKEGKVKKKVVYTEI